jgi:MFS family permease
VTVAPILALELTGSPTLTGLPGAVGVVGTALGATIVSRVMARRGARRPGLVLGYTIAAAGALIAATATFVQSFALLLAAMVAIGCGNSASNLARYAAADPYPESRRSSIIGFVIWAATIGAVTGPVLGTSAGRPLARLGLAPLAGGFLVAFVGFALGAVAFALLLRPDPAALSEAAEPTAVRAAAPATTPRATSSHARLALGGLVVSHSVMVLTMTMAPVHLRHHGVTLGAIGAVMSSHVLGMYALTPVAGFLAQRFGNTAVLATGLVLLALAGVGAALAPDGDATALGGALFVLGLGWSCGFVAASGVLAQGAQRAERARRQGAADTIVFAAAAVASLSSGVIVSAIGYPALALLGSAIAIIAAGVVAYYTLNRTWMISPSETM